MRLIKPGGGCVSDDDNVVELHGNRAGGKRQGAGRPKGRKSGSKRNRAEVRLEWIAAVARDAGEDPDLVWLGDKEGWYWRDTVSRVWVPYLDAAVRKLVKGLLAGSVPEELPKSLPTGRDLGDCMTLVKVAATPQGVKKRSKTGLLPGPWNMFTGADCVDFTYWRNYVTELLDDDWPDFKYHDEDVFMTRSLPWDYQRTPEPTPMWEQFLEAAMPDEYVGFFLEAMVGRSLARDTDFHCLPVIHGPAGTGKTTFVQILSRLAGLRSVTEVNAASDLGGRFAGEIFVRSQIIVIEELDRTERSPSPAERLGRSRIKAITGGVAPSAEAKYESGRRVVDKPPTVWMCGNYLPLWIQGAKDVGAWKRRLVIIPFVRPVPDGDVIRGLAQKIVAAEGAAIASRCYHRWSVWRRGGYEVPGVCREALHTLITQSLPLAKRWAVERLEAASGVETSADAIHENAAGWYEQRGADYDRVREGARVLAQVRALGAKPYRTKAGMVYVGVQVRGGSGGEAFSF